MRNSTLHSTLQGIVFSLLISFFVVGCESLGPIPKPPSQFVAKLEDFAGYKTWQAIDYTIGSTNPALGEAHMGKNNAYSRRIYMNPSGKREEEEYALGTIFVKETFTWEDGKQKFADMGGIFAMVKRSGDFNPDGGGWEWFELSPDLSAIVGRGGEEMMGGMCNSCHDMAGAQPRGADYVFPHPGEYAAVDADFSDYKTWTLLHETKAPHPVLGGAHKSTDPNAVRRVYKKQILANPDTEAQGYPMGTVIVKEIEQNSAITEITAMVKRGGNFNPKHGGWEWFMLEPSKLAIMGRGADLMDGMCNSCHKAAEEPKYGKNYVFKHPNDPFNK